MEHGGVAMCREVGGRGEREGEGEKVLVRMQGRFMYSHTTMLAASLSVCHVTARTPANTHPTVNLVSVRALG